MNQDLDYSIEYKDGRFEIVVGEKAEHYHYGNTIFIEKVLVCEVVLHSNHELNTLECKKFVSELYDKRKIYDDLFDEDIVKFL